MELKNVVPSSRKDMDPSPGTVLLGKYRVEGVVGRGGMGTVFRVTHVQLGEQLALKLLLPDAAANPELVARFLREAQSVVRLRGEHVARVSDVGVLSNGVPYIAMEYLRGVDLATELGRRALISGEVVDYVLQACEALAEAHANDIVHRDVKPSNLFLTTRPDGTPLLKVLDFGISKAPVGAGPVVTTTDIVMGTPGYMSPEQMKAARDVDGRTDIWGLGIVLYECLNRRRPFEAASYSAIVLMAGTEPPPAMDPRIPRGLQAVVLRCLEKERVARFSSIAALAVALAPFARDRRAAATVVDRTRLMLQRSIMQLTPVVLPKAPQDPTTLSGSNTALAPAQRRRKMIGGRLLVVGAMIVLGLTGLIISSQPAGPTAGGLPGTNREPVAEAGVIASAAVEKTSIGADPTRVATGSTVAPDNNALAQTTTGAGVAANGNAPVQTTAEGGATAESDMPVRATAARCAELNVQHDWQGLVDCAIALDRAGDKDRAKEYTEIATREQRNELTANDIQALLSTGNLRDVERMVDKLGNDSVYFVTLRDQLTRSEDAAIEHELRDAQVLAAAHDCPALRARYKQLTITSTHRVATAVRAIKCADKVVAPMTVAAQSPLPVPSPPGNAAGGDATTAMSTQRADPCIGVIVDDVMNQAGHVYGTGDAKAALALMVKALACKQSPLMYRHAAIYACGAHNLDSAKLYFAKINPQFQSAIVQRCQQEGLDVRPPP